MSGTSDSGDSNCCCCNLHEEAVTSNPSMSQMFVALSNYTELPKELTPLVETHCIGHSRRKGAKICKGCVSLLRNKQEEAAESHNKKRKTYSPKLEPGSSFVFEDFINSLKVHDFSEAELQKLLHVIGEKIGGGLADYVADKCKLEMNTKLLEMTSDGVQWTNTYAPIRSFMEGLIHGVTKDHNRDTSDTGKLRRVKLLYHAMEVIYAATNSRYVSSLALAEMLYIYFISSSRRASQIHAAATGCASYFSLQSALGSIANSTPSLPKSGYIVVAFDNNQVLGKTYRVQLESKLRINVVTTVTAFHFSPSFNPQNQDASFPMYLDLDDTGKSKLLAKLHDFRLRARATVNEYRIQYLETRLRHLLNADLIDKNDPNLTDYVTTGKHIPPERIGLNHSRVAERGFECNIMDQSCILENPNSYKGVEHVIDEILKVSLSENRKWVTLVADGLPYSIAQELLRHLVRCSVCGESFLETSAPSHYESKHQMGLPTKLERKFQNVLLRPGAGHYEMNLLRTIFSEWFHIFIEPVAELMGSRSAKAKAYCASAADHHKSWQILEIIFEALTDELLYAYIHHYYQRRNRPNDEEPSVADFLSEINSTPNEYMKGAYEFLLEFSFPLLLFRSGVRQCNFDVTIQAREYAAAAFYAFRHPKYQKINCYDMAKLLQIPLEYREAVYVESLRIPGSNVGQGIDFLLEQRNRKLKAFVVHNGVPTNEQWLQASKSLPKLEQIVTAVSSRLGIPVPEISDHNHSLAEEKLAARKYFRSTGILSFSISQKLVTTNEVEVSPEFLICRKIADENQAAYYDEFIKTGKSRVTRIVEAVPASRPTTSWTVVKLRQEIKAKCNGIPTDQRPNYLQGISTARKDNLIQRYESLMQLIGDIEVPVDNIELD